MESTARLKVSLKTNKPFSYRMDKNVEKGTREDGYQNINEIESSKYCKSL